MMGKYSRHLGGRWAELCGRCIYSLVLGEVHLVKSCKFGCLNRSYIVSWLKQIVVL